MPDTSINILWTISVGTFVLLLLAVGFIMAIVQSKRREMAAKQRELEELTERELKYRNLFENSLAGMLPFTAESMEVLDANQTLRRMFGVQEFIEIQQVIQTIPPPDLAQLHSTMKQNGTIENFETTVRRKDKIELSISFSGKYFQQEGWIEGVIIDVTKRKRLEANQLRTQRTESIGVLASGMAHDLKNMIVPVKIAVEVLKHKHGDPKSQSLLTSIELSAEHSLDLVRQVLAFVRGVEGKYIPVKASEILRSVIYAIQETLPSNIQVESNIPDIPTMILGDPTQLRQVFVNLINNAKDAMPQGGHLTATFSEIQVSKSMADTIHNTTEGKFACWTITDNGFGIPAEQIEKIFEPFYTTKEIGEGTGLGLSIVSGIIKGHKGFITVESLVKRGTTFHIYLPVLDDRQKTSE